MKYLATALLLMALVGCGGGGSPGSVLSTSQRYIGAAGLGELVQFDVNTDTLKFTYQILESQFGLTGVTKTGDLVANADGSYTQSSNPASRLRIASDGLMFGTISETFNSIAKNTVFFGSKSPSVSSAAIVGMYNFITKVCTDNGCTGHYGTIRFQSSGNWTYCMEENLSDDVALFYQSGQPFGARMCQYSDGGTYDLDGNIWRLKANIRTGESDPGSSPEVIGSAIFTERPAGNILTVDWKDNRQGYKIFNSGYLIGVTQQHATVNSTAVVFNRIADNGTISSIDIDITGNVFSNGISYGIPVLDRPFKGFKTVTSTGSISLQLLGTGVYFSYLPRTGQTVVGFQAEAD